MSEADEGAAEKASSSSSLSASGIQAARRFWATSFARGALFVVVGVVMYLWTSQALDVLTWLLIAVLVLQALILLIESQRLTAAGKDSPVWRLVLAIVAIIAAIAILVWPDRSVTVVLRIVAVWALVAGVINAVRARKAYQERQPGWSWELTVALMWVVFGVLVLIKPLKDLEAVAGVLSVYLVVTGIVLLMSAFTVRVAAKDAQSASVAVGDGGDAGADTNLTPPSGTTPPSSPGA